MQKISRAQKIGMAVFVFFLILGASWLYLICTLPLPDYASYKVKWIPEGVRIMPRSRVHIGTFRIDAESIDAIKERCKKIPDPSAIKVVYATTSDHNISQVMREPGIYYWVPDGFGAYDYAVDLVPKFFPWRDWILFEQSITFKEDTGEFIYSFFRFSGSAFLAAFLVMVSLLLISFWFYCFFAQAQAEETR